MQFTVVSGAAVLLALAQSALSLGTARVVNNCGFDVYYASVAQFVASPMQKLPAGGFSEAYALQNVGISIKMARNPTDHPTQFEFTWAAGKINYDISHIDGNPFMAYGTSLAPSMVGDKANPSCQVVNCPAGANPCTAAYNEPNDVRTMVCDQNSDLTFTLCTSHGASARSIEEETITESADIVERDASAVHSHGRQHARHLPKK